MDRAETVVPMSDRRLLLAVIGTLAAALGLALILLSLLGLRHPIGASGGTWALTDLSAPLTGLAVLGALVMVGGATTAVALVRAQLRSRTR